MKCGFCEKELNNIRKLSKHIRDIHKGINIKEYYDKFIKKTEEGKCAICNTETRFISLGIGYSLTCSNKCGCTYHRKKLKESPEKYKLFVEKVKLNQTSIWKSREINGEKEIIVEKVRNSTIKYINLLTKEEKEKRFGWLNKLSGKEKEDKIKFLLSKSLIPYYESLSKEETEKLIQKRLKSKEEKGSIRRLCDKTEFEIFEQKTRNLSNKTYNKYKSEIDPNNLRGKNYHLDHKVSIIFGFINKIPEEILSSKENLQIITAEENMRKHGKCSITIEELLNVKLCEEWQISSRVLCSKK